MYSTKSIKLVYKRRNGKIIKFRDAGRFSRRKNKEGAKRHFNVYNDHSEGVQRKESTDYKIVFDQNLETITTV